MTNNIILLEEKIMHLELDNEQLNQALFKQQQTLDKLENSLLFLNKELEKIKENQDNMSNISDELPPHY